MSLHHPRGDVRFDRPRRLGCPGAPFRRREGQGWPRFAWGRAAALRACPSPSSPRFARAGVRASRAPESALRARRSPRFARVRGSERLHRNAATANVCPNSRMQRRHHCKCASASFAYPCCGAVAMKSLAGRAGWNCSTSGITNDAVWGPLVRAVERACICSRATPPGPEVYCSLFTRCAAKHLQPLRALTTFATRTRRLRWTSRLGTSRPGGAPSLCFPGIPAGSLLECTSACRGAPRSVHEAYEPQRPLTRTTGGERRCLTEKLVSASSTKRSNATPRRAPKLSKPKDSKTGTSAKPSCTSSPASFSSSKATQTQRAVTRGAALTWARLSRASARVGKPRAVGEGTHAPAPSQQRSTNGVHPSRASANHGDGRFAPSAPSRSEQSGVKGNSRFATM